MSTISYPLQSIIAKKDRLMKAFWAPAFRHWDDIKSENIPSAKELDKDFLRGFFILDNYASANRFVMLGHDKMKKTLEDLSRYYPERVNETYAILSSIKRRCLYGRHNTNYDPGYLTHIFMETCNNKLNVYLYEAEYLMDLDKKEAGVILPENFNDDRTTTVHVSNIDFSKRLLHRASIVTGEKNNPALVASLEINEKNANRDWITYIDWRDGYATHLAFTLQNNGGRYRIIPTPQ